mmetsp:Transcript_26869/g.48307  ORF Transcript_26869/g.48307 Transcript_26869/m.48307 type:complete len:205 (-) Transcript_26869:181-795(-)
MIPLLSGAILMLLLSTPIRHCEGWAPGVYRLRNGSSSEQGKLVSLFKWYNLKLLMFFPYDKRFKQRKHPNKKKSCRPHATPPSATVSTLPCCFRVGNTQSTAPTPLCSQTKTCASGRFRSQKSFQQIGRRGAQREGRQEKRRKQEGTEGKDDFFWVPPAGRLIIPLDQRETKREDGEGEAEREYKDFCGYPARPNGYPQMEMQP